MADLDLLVRIRRDLSSWYNQIKVTRGTYQVDVNRIIKGINDYLALEYLNQRIDDYKVQVVTYHNDSHKITYSFKEIGGLWRYTNMYIPEREDPYQSYERAMKGI